MLALLDLWSKTARVAGGCLGLGIVWDIAAPNGGRVPRINSDPSLPFSTNLTQRPFPHTVLHHHTHTNNGWTGRQVLQETPTSRKYAPLQARLSKAVMNMSYLHALHFGCHWSVRKECTHLVHFLFWVEMTANSDCKFERKGQ